MKPYLPSPPHRRSLRFQGYDYSQAGLYFITICCQGRLCLFGEVDNGKRMLNDAGEIAVKCWNEIPEHFNPTRLHAYVIMPNHIHGIIELSDIVPVGAKNISPESISQPVVGAKNFSPLQSPEPSSQPIPEPSSQPIPEPSPQPIPEPSFQPIPEPSPQPIPEPSPQPISQPSSQPVGAKNFSPQPIRNEQSYIRITEYIMNNPATWTEDKLLVP